MLDFPAAPAPGEVFIANGVSYVWQSSPGFWNDGPGQSADWPWDDAATIADLDFTTAEYWSGSLGEITAAQAIVSTRTSSTLAFNGDGLLEEFAASTPAIATGRGLWALTGSSGRIDFNNDLANAAWTKTNITAAQDLPTPFAAGTPAGWRITATAANATITQSYTTPAPGAIFNYFIPSAMFWWDGAPLAGAVEISQDNFVTVLDIRSQLVAGKWVQIAGAVKVLPDPTVTETVGVRIVASGDSVGFCLCNVERNYVMTPPVLTPAALTVNRATDYTEMILANFPPLWNKPQFTVLAVVEPQMKPLPPFGSATQPRTGWTALEINNEYEISGEGIGELTPYGGPGQGSLMTLDSVLPGSDIQVGHRLVVENGVGSFSDITSQESGTPGGAGTYRVFSPIWPNGQNTPPNIAIRVRYRTAQGYGLNAALKPDDDWAQRIGVTFTAEPELDEFGNDPQEHDFVFNAVNCDGWTVDTTKAGTAEVAGHVALNGGTEAIHVDQFTHAPALDATMRVTLGTQYPAAAGSLDGPISRLIIIGRRLSASEISAATTVLRQRYIT